MQAIETSDADNEAGWVDGRLAFEHTPLAEVVAELERHHPVRFVFADPALARQTLSGSFDIADLQPFLRAVETMLPVRAVRKKQTIVISGRRQFGFHPRASTMIAQRASIIVHGRQES